MKANIELANLSRIIRERTIRRIDQIPEGFINWRLNNTAMSFVEIVQHLIHVDELFLNLMKSPKKHYIWVLGTDEPNMHVGEQTFGSMMGKLKSLQEKREKVIRNLSDKEMIQKVSNENDEEMTLWWFIMRNLIEHEVYHRGQMSAYLKLLKGEIATALPLI